MATANHAFKQLQNLPLRFDDYMPKPSFYPKDSNSIIISTNDEDTNPGVFKYNIDNNNLEKLVEYVEIQPAFHGQFIDYNNNTLHILSEWENTHITIDLKTKTINNKYTSNCG
eukprot:86511_1